MQQVESPTEQDSSTKPTRRLKPGVAAKLAAEMAGAEIRKLYERPVEELAPEEIARMRAAFFRG